MRNISYDAVAYPLKVWFTTLLLAPFNYFCLVSYLLPQARMLTFKEGLAHSFWVWVAGLWGYFPTLLFFLIVQNLLRRKLAHSAAARSGLVFSGVLFTALNVFVAGTLAGFFQFDLVRGLYLPAGFYGNFLYHLHAGSGSVYALGVKFCLPVLSS